MATPRDFTADERAALEARVAELEQEAAARESGAFTGVARCPNPGCEKFDSSSPIALREDVVNRYAEDIPGYVLTNAIYLVPIDDADLACPGCGASRSIAKAEPPAYPKMTVA